MTPKPPTCPICGTPTEYKSQIAASDGRVLAPEENYCKKCKRNVKIEVNK
jgi:hypothetical protein